MPDTSGDKKHSATDRKRRQAREQGQVVRSQDLTSAALLLAAVSALWMLAGTTGQHITEGITEALSSQTLAMNSTADASNYLLRIGSSLAYAAIPFMVVMMAAGIMINVVQTGLMVSTEKLVPKLSHINPLSGVKRIVSLQGVMRLGFGIFKVGIIAVVAFFALRTYQDQLVGLALMSVPQIISTLFETLISVCVWIGGALFILALLEYAFQKWKFEQDLMMSDQEIRDEMKDTEGDPQMKAQRRQVQRQLAMSQVAQDVPQADVVVSNPTELAIAIKYDPTSMPAPQVLAKGAGVLAQRIRRIALEHGIPVVERKPLAQVLYKTVDVGDVVPADQYQAVAEVLRYVYQLQGKEVPKAG